MPGLAIASFAVIAALSSAPTVTQPAPAAGRVLNVGTLIVAHGGGPAWNAQVEAVAKQVRTGGPVEVSFLMGPGAATARFQDAAKRLVAAGATQIVVVPVLVSSHSGHYEQIRYLAGEVDSLDAVMMHHLHMAGIERAETGVPMRVARAMDDATEIADVLADRALKLVSSPSHHGLVLVGHGPNSAEDHAAWMENLRRVAARVQEHSGFHTVKVGLVRDDAPTAVRAEAVRSVRETIELLHAITKEPVVVVPVMVSKGQITDEKIPADLAGLPIVYDGVALLPHSQMARWVESRVRMAIPPDGVM